MAWVRLDDEFDEHPKIARVGPFGAWLQVQALCYCNRNLTDGFVPLAIAEAFMRRGIVRIDEAGRRWTLGETCGMHGRDVQEADWAAVLVEAGMWEVVPGGYRIHDYKDYQPSKARVIAARKAWNARQKQHREKVSRRDSRVSHASPVPVPVPESKEETLSFASLTQGDATSPRPTELGFDRFWLTYPKKRHKPAALRAWKVTDGARHLEAILVSVERWKDSDAWRRGFVEDAATFLRQRQWEDEPPRQQSCGISARTAGNVAAIARGLEITRP